MLEIFGDVLELNAVENMVIFRSVNFIGSLMCFENAGARKFETVEGFLFLFVHIYFYKICELKGDVGLQGVCNRCQVLLYILCNTVFARFKLVDLYVLICGSRANLVMNARVFLYG